MDCTACDLHKTCKTINVPPDNETGDILLLGEAPGAEEDLAGTPFVGRSGQFIRNIFDKLDIPKERIRFSNSVRCHPPGNKTPTAKQMKACKQHLIDELARIPTTHIVALGGVALKMLQEIGVLKVSGTIMSLHGEPIQTDDYVIYPMFHPAYIMRNAESISAYAAAANGFEDVFLHGVPQPKPTEYTYSAELDELSSALDVAVATGTVAYDIETSCLFPYSNKDARIVSFAFTWDRAQAFGFWMTPETYDVALDLLHSKLLENSNVKKIIQHVKFELLWSMHYGRTITNFADTMLMHWHTDERNGTHGLSKLALAYTDMRFYDSALEEYKKAHKEADPSKKLKDPDTGEITYGSYANIPPEILLPYNCADTDAAYRIYDILKLQITENQQWILENVQYPACYPLADMELRGVPIDWNLAQKLDVDLPARAEELAAQILEYPEVQAYTESRDKPINFNSTLQLRELLFKYLKLEPLYMTSKGAPSTDKHVLAYLAQQHPVPALIKERRGLITLHSTFVKGAFEQRHGNAIHTSYGMAHTETGRYNSQGPNLQNIPRDALIKNMYVPDENCWMVQADFSQVELRVLALFSGDRALLQYFKDGGDVHQMVAAKIHKKEPTDITKEERVRAKRTVFGLCYGQGSKGLAEELGIKETEAEDFLQKFFREFPSVKRWMNKTKKAAERDGQVETMFGRVRRLPDAQIESARHPSKTRAMRQAINMPIQGTAADILAMKKAHVYQHLQSERLRTRMLLTVHDSIVFSVPDDEINYIVPAVKMLMEDFSDLDWIKIPIICDLEIGACWGELIALSDVNINQLAQGIPIDTVLAELL